MTAAAAALVGAPAHAVPVTVTPSLVADLVPGVGSSDLYNFTALGSTLFFTADAGGTGTELWKSDGTAAGTQRVADIRPGAGGSYPSSLTAVGGTLFFAASDGATGTELWKSDGTTTERVSDINPGTGTSYPSSLTAVGGSLFFSATDGTTGRELWKSDGTTAGTTLVRDINPAAGVSGISSNARMVAVGGTVFLTANDGATGSELWKSDGTTAGTTLVKDIRAGSGGSLYSYYSSNTFTAVGGSLFFAADDGVSGRELWRSDGTTAGTTLVKDVSPGSGSGLSSYNNTMLAAGGTLYFVGSDSISGTELWKSDGSTAGTSLVADINPSTRSSAPRELTVVGSTVMFTAINRASGRELWRTDGSAAGTSQIAEIAPGTFGSNPYSLTDVGGTVFFSATNGIHGQELWSTDGTAANTALRGDIYAGVDDSDPYSLTNVNGTLMFTAMTEAQGRELWRATVGPAAPVTPVTPPVADTAVSGAVVKAKASQKQGKKVKVVVRASAAEAVTVNAAGKIKIAGTKKAIKITTKPVTTSGAGAIATMKLKPSKKNGVKVLAAVKRYRNADTKAEKKARTVKAKVTVTMTDKAGNKVVKKVVVKLV